MKLEEIDARERRRKAKWHAARAGTNKNASFSKMIHHDYEAELLERGVKDSQGNQTPMKMFDKDFAFR